jgi:DNA-binding transcriptional LysR family regulator
VSDRLRGPDGFSPSLARGMVRGTHAALRGRCRCVAAMIDWDDLRHFLAVQRSGTLARAASALGINATTVSRRLSALETRVHARLFDRTPEGYVLTPAGRDLLYRAERMEAEALALEREVLGADQRLAGSVRVTATEMIGTRFVMPHLPQFRAQHPEVAIELECSHRHVSLTRREADIALRLARPHEENVVTRRLAPIPLALYAAPSYLSSRGAPADAEHSLAGHELVLFAASRAFRVENAWFEPRMAGARIALRSDSVSAIFAATLAGAGIALLPRAAAEREPGLVQIATETAPEPRVIWQTVHADLQKSARVRAVLDFLAQVLLPAASRGA